MEFPLPRRPNGLRSVSYRPSWKPPGASGAETRILVFIGSTFSPEFVGQLPVRARQMRYQGLELLRTISILLSHSYGGAEERAAAKRGADPSLPPETHQTAVRALGTRSGYQALPDLRTIVSLPLSMPEKSGDGVLRHRLGHACPLLGIPSHGGHAAPGL